MRVAILHTVFLLAAVSVVANACAHNKIAGAPTPITNSPAARQTATSATGDLADASVQLSPTKGHTAAGQLRLTTGSNGVRVMGTLTALAPNSKHGIHIHENGDCSAQDARAREDTSTRYVISMEHRGAARMSAISATSLPIRLEWLMSMYGFLGLR